MENLNSGIGTRSLIANNQANMPPNLIIPDDIVSLWVDEMKPPPGQIRLLIYIYLQDNREEYMKLIICPRISISSIITICIGRYYPEFLRNNDNVRYHFAKVLVLDQAKNTYALRTLKKTDRTNDVGIQDLDLLYLHITHIP